MVGDHVARRERQKQRQNAVDQAALELGQVLDEGMFGWLCHLFNKRSPRPFHRRPRAVYFEVHEQRKREPPGMAAIEDTP